MRTLFHEPRLIGGIALMLAATIAGAVFLQQATERTAVWVMSRPLAADSVISAGDVELAEVAVPASAALSVQREVTGRRLAHDMAAGELLTSSALADEESRPAEVAIPVERLHAPQGLRRGERVDVWWSSEKRGDSPVKVRLVLPLALVAAVEEAEVAGGRAIVLAVTPQQSGRLVIALRSGAIDLVRSGSEVPMSSSSTPVAGPSVRAVGGDA